MHLDWDFKQAGCDGQAEKTCLAFPELILVSRSSESGWGVLTVSVAPRHVQAWQMEVMEDSPYFGPAPTIFRAGPPWWWAPPQDG